MKLIINNVTNRSSKRSCHRNVRDILPLFLVFIVLSSLLCACDVIPQDKGFVSFVSVDSDRYHTRNHPGWEMSESTDGRMYHIGRFWKSTNLFATELTFYTRVTMEQEESLVLETYPYQSDDFTPLSTIMLDTGTVLMLRYDSENFTIIEDRFIGVDTENPSEQLEKTSRNIYSYADTYYNFKAQYFRDSLGQPTLAVKTLDGYERKLELYKLDSLGEWVLTRTMEEGIWERMIFYVEPNGISIIAGDNGVYVKNHGGDWIYEDGVEDIIQFTKNTNGLFASDLEGNIYKVNGTSFILVHEFDYENGMSIFNNDGSIVLLQTLPYSPPPRSLNSRSQERGVIIIGGTPTQHQSTEALMIFADGSRKCQEIYDNSYLSEDAPIQFRFSIIKDSYGNAVLPLYGQWTSTSINWKGVVIDWEI